MVAHGATNGNSPWGSGYFSAGLLVGRRAVAQLAYGVVSGGGVVRALAAVMIAVSAVLLMMEMVVTMMMVVMAVAIAHGAAKILSR